MNPAQSSPQTPTRSAAGDDAAYTSRFTEGSMKGGRWLAGQLDERGLLPTDLSLHACHKGVWALAVAGQVETAHRLLDAIARHQMSAPGEFYPDGAGTEDGFRAYYAAIVLVGAARIGRIDIASSAAADRLCAYQHPCGGFAGLIDPPAATINLCVTAQCGWAALALGREQVALRTADFIADLFEAQPDLSRYLYFNTDPKGRLITEFPPNRAPEYRLDTVQAEQGFFYAGIAAGYLADLHTLSGRSRYLEAARGFIDFDLTTNPDSFKWPSKCKVGWGAALLYRVTGENRYRQLAEQVADITWLGAQKEDGSWGGMSIPLSDDGEVSLIAPHEITAEFTYELAEVAGALASG